MNAKTIITFLLLLISADQVSAQYFGRNKIRARNFDFTVLKTEHFDIYCYSIENHALILTAEMLERWHERFARVFNFSLGHQIVIIYRNRSDFTQTTVMSYLIEQGLGGVREPRGRRILLALTGINGDDEHLVGHEVAHAFQLSLIVRNSLPLLPTQTFPAWYVEGMAEYLTLGASDPVTAQWMRDLRESGHFPSFYEAGHNENLYSPFHVGQAIWAFITGTWGDTSIAPLSIAILKYGWKSGFRRALGINVDSVSSLWQASAARTFSWQTPQPPPRKPLDSCPGTSSNEGNNAIQFSNTDDSRFSPSLSPDGGKVAFIGWEDKFSSSVSIADVRTGKVLRKLLTFNRDAHFEAVSFIKSSGEWSPDGTKIAVTSYIDGESVIEVFDLSSEKAPASIKVTGVDDITGISWSPDGHSMAISCTIGGEDCLYLYNMKGSSLSVLMKGPYTCVQPSWSPDGRFIAYVTDSGSGTSLEHAVYSPLRICLLDIANGEKKSIALSDKARNYCPRFSLDGGSVYFVSDPDGFSDLYRYECSSGRIYRITKSSTGINGLTRYSPVFSIARSSNSIIYGSLHGGYFSLYRLDDSCLRGSLVAFSDTSGYSEAIALFAGVGNELTRSYLADWRGGMVSPQTLFFSPYVPRWSLKYAGQFFVGSAGNEYGLSPGSGSLIYADVLGNRLLSFSAQIDTFSLDGIGLKAGYLNQGTRFNWGISASHLPYHTPQVFFNPDTAFVNGSPVPAQTTTILRQRDFADELNAVLQRPLSVNTRLEVNLSYTLQYFENNVTRATVPSGGTHFGPPPPLFETPAPIHTVSLTGAYIGDYSLDGFCAPRSGSRFHLEAGPVVGSVFYAYIQADYRYYLSLRPFTLAFRALHVGEYGGELSSGELPILNLGFPTWVRGYSTQSFDFSGGVNDTSRTGEGAIFNRLIGSKVAIGNVELRLPILGSQQIGLIDFAYLPTDLFLFVDGGLAWINNQGVSLQLTAKPDERTPLFSTGGGLRSNLLGAIVGSVFLVYPVQRPHKRPFFDFEISTGW